MPSAHDRPWAGVWAVDKALDRRAGPPRRGGVTMVIDTGIGMTTLNDILELAGCHVDHWKLAFGTSALITRSLLERKLQVLKGRNILTFPGGTLLEAAVVQQHCRVFMRRARELGFTAVEISEGSIDLPPDRRRRIVDCALDAGLVPITEVGRKDPDRQPTADQLVEQALLDLEWGAAWVINEARESGEGIGIYDSRGRICEKALETIARGMGEKADRIVWEAPLKAQQAALVRRFGVNVSLGNINPYDVLALEALRRGLRFETLNPLALKKAAAGEWDPAAVEQDHLGQAAGARP
ncbi:MAG: phosphosulfolactate synthase [Betaproteobacteria bacterium]|nr:phosphosulfolactate synthase [Betaproteobacteria bacterium]